MTIETVEQRGRSLPPYPGVRPLRLVLTILALAGIAASFPFSGADPAALVEPDNIAAAARFVGALFPPELAPSYLRRVLRLIGETVAISVAGTVLAVIVAVPLALGALRRRGAEMERATLGTRSWAAGLAGYGAARGVLNLARAVPELVWALVFVVMVGLGPFAGTLALATHSAGILGKLYAELLETVDQRAVEAVRATGATEGQVTALARVPLALPVLLSYTLFRWECNLRAATVLGLVGAGGIGTELILSFKLFRYHELLTLIVAILLLITLVDLCGQLLRTYLLDPQARADRQLEQAVQTGDSASVAEPQVVSGEALLAEDRSASRRRR